MMMTVRSEDDGSVLNLGRFVCVVCFDCVAREKRNVGERGSNNSYIRHSLACALIPGTRMPQMPKNLSTCWHSIIREIIRFVKYIVTDKQQFY